MKNRIGYCCLSIGINENLKKKDHVLVNRGMVRKTFDAKGLPYVADLIVENLKDTLKVLDYNIKNDIRVYRLSSDSFPWMSEYSFENLPRFAVINSFLKVIGKKIRENDMRVSYHPGQFNVLGSENPSVVAKTIDELNKHAQLLDLMELEQSTYYPINIHVNTTQPTREDAAKRFCEGFQSLSDSCKKRLTVENDDKLSQYSVKILYDLVHSQIGIPIVFDSFHHKFNSDGLSEEQALNLAISTWKTKPLCHHSSSRKIYEDKSAKSESHSDFIYEKFNDYGKSLDVELECKMKDLALKKYIFEFLK
jgi:UV DNA damage endonuclease